MQENSRAVRRLLFFRHGILINRWFMMPMARYFRSRGYEIHNSSYPSTQKTIEEHAEDFFHCLERAVQSAGGAVELYFITHSMGGLILRYTLTHFQIPHCRRAVMLVPPNQGSSKAQYYRNNLLFRAIYGRKAGRQLAEDSSGIFSRCGIPKGLEIGVIAGTSSPLQFFPAPLEKPHDGVVSYRETWLESAPVYRIEASHTLLLWKSKVWKAAECFLSQGRFPAPEDPAARD